MSPRVLALALCLGATFSAAATAQGCKLVGVGNLPVTMSGTQPLISGAINGIEARFLLDTGAAFSLLSQGAIEKFKLKPLKRFSNVPVGGVGGSFMAKGASADRFSLIGFGSGESKNVQFIVGGPSYGLNVDGIIGQNVIGSFDSEYDLANGAIRLFRASDCEQKPMAYWAKTESVAVMDIDTTHPTAPHLLGAAFLNGHKIGIMFDTGASRSMLTRKAAQQAGVNPGDEGVVASGYSYGVSGTRVNTWLARFDSLDLGGEQIKNARLRIGDTTLFGDTQMLLGADFFLSHRVYVAKGQSKIYFTYNGGRVFDLSTSNEGENSISAEVGATMAPAETNASAPVTAAGFRRRGAASMARNDMRSAMADFDAAIKLDPSDAENYRQRALAYGKDNKTDLALSDFDQALVLKPDWVPLLIERGTTHIAKRNATAAAADFAKAVDLSPGDTGIGLDAAMRFVATNNQSEAIQLLDQWIASYPKDSRVASALNTRCIMRTMRKEFELALQDCDAAIKRMRNAPFLDTRGAVWILLGNFAKASDDYKVALRMAPKNARSQYGLGIAKIRSGNKEAGQKDIDAALALAPKVGEQFKALGIEL